MVSNTRIAEIASGTSGDPQSQAMQSGQDVPRGLQSTKFLDALDEAAKPCYEQAAKFRDSFDRNRATTNWIAGVGIIAGSIVVPALAAASASAAVVAGFGGVAGATNAYQLTLNSQGLSAKAAADAYDTFVVEVRKMTSEELKTITTGKDEAAQVLKVRAYCSMPPLPKVEEAKDMAVDATAFAKSQAEISKINLEREKTEAEIAVEREKRVKAETAAGKTSK